MNTYLAQLTDYGRRLSMPQRLTLGAAVVGGLVLLGGVAYWAGRPDYALLFGGLEASDAARVVEQLDAEGVRYDLREGGAAVFVPRGEVYELRLRFAAEGVVSDGQTGYELFDGGTLGMTDFMQKVSYKRALEGELARTIANVRGIDLARVHLVLPERNPFRDRQVEASASVVLQLAGGVTPPREHVTAITALVAGAVEGLGPSGVTVVDAQGNLLSDPAEAEASGALSSSQLRYQRAVEEHLAGQGQSMLDRVLGSGRAIVRVATSLDFSRTVTESERIDPESATVISEERMDEQGAGGGASTSVRNYELSREREQREQGAGEVRYLTVSVILDHRPAEVPEGADKDAPLPDPIPYAADELAEIEALVRNAVGFNEERGDRITVQQARFDTSSDDAFAAEWQAQRRDERLRLLLRYGLMALALGIGAWLLRAATARVATLALPANVPAAAPTTPPAPAASTAPPPSGDGLPEERLVTIAQHRIQEPPPATAATAGARPSVVVDDLYTSRLSPDARAQLNAKRQFYESVQTMAAENPETAAGLVASWLSEDRNRRN